MERSLHSLCERTEPRVQFFVAALLRFAGKAVPVRIRNFSPSGARIEAGEIPPTGTMVELHRGRLKAQGAVVWCEEEEAGITFEEPVDIFEWMPDGGGAQARVDAVAGALRQGCAPDQVAAWDNDDPVAEFAELGRLADMLEELADVLSADRALTSEQCETLQVLDVAAQRLRKIAAS